MKFWKSWIPHDIAITFALPLYIVISIFFALLFEYILHLRIISIGILLCAIGVGSVDLVKDTMHAVFHKRFALDYIALLAIIVSVSTGHFFVCAIIVLMLSSGRTLEKFGMNRAKKSLSRLISRIPAEANMWTGGHISGRVPVVDVQVGQTIAVRRGEVVPLDGILVSKNSTIDESSLTGEPYFIDKVTGDVMRSGTVNLGDIVVVRVTKPSGQSAYAKIISMVEEAQESKAPLIRLADRYSVIFTVITLTIAGIAYGVSHDMTRVLAVLVIATPCPLILATPIALIGGINAAAKKRTIIKDIGSIEVLSRVSAMVFDKTGTITLGKPSVTHIERFDDAYTHAHILQIADALERNSLHPLAKAVVEEAKSRKITKLHASDCVEHIGRGISGVVRGLTYLMTKASVDTGMAIDLKQGAKHIARFDFTDHIKSNAKHIMATLIARGLSLYLYTGDKKAQAEIVASSLGVPVSVCADMSPEAKMRGIEILKNNHHITAMVGDGINDAPALALADVGMVFAHAEQTAASEAADVVFFGGDFADVAWVLAMSRRTISIALQSIIVGIGVSTLGMIAAALGYIPPTAGAALQELVDIFVIINALRTSRIPRV